MTKKSKPKSKKTKPNKSKKKSKKQQKQTKPVSNQVSPVYYPPRLLTDYSLKLHETPDVGGAPAAPPPPTPTSNFTFEYNINSIPKQFPQLANLDIPRIGDVGVKVSLERLAYFFDCPDYKSNLIQFWYLDIIADCLWRVQHTHNFPVDYQKIVLEWILFMFHLIQAPEMNFSRTRLFQVFSEATIMAEEQIHLSDAVFPLPTAIFACVLKQKDDVVSLASFGGSSLTSHSSNSLPSIITRNETTCCSCMAPRVQGQAEYFRAPSCRWSDYYQFQAEVLAPDKNSNSIGPEAANNTNDIDEEFYQADLNTPDRFKSLSQAESTNIIDYENQNQDQRSTEKEVSSETLLRGEINKLPIMEEIQQYKSWAQKLTGQINQQASPNVPSFTLIHNSSNFHDEEQLKMVEEDLHSTEKEYKASIEENDNQIQLMHVCVLSVIKHLVFLYFHDSFESTLVMFALRAQHTAISQQMNDAWNKPRTIKEEVVSKPNKKKKNTKGKSKKSKTSSKSSKKSGKPSKIKADKQIIMDKKEEQYICDLSAAVTDEFFQEIFENWTKPSETKKKSKSKPKTKKGNKK